MTELDPDHATRLLLGDLATERDRFVAALFEFAEGSAVVDEQGDRIAGQIRMAKQESARITALASAPKLSPESRRLLHAALDALALQIDELMAAIAVFGDAEDGDLQGAIALRDRFLRLELSQHHQELGVAQTADFDRRKADMIDMVKAAVCSAASTGTDSAPAKASESISTVIDGNIGNRRSPWARGRQRQRSRSWPDWVFGLGSLAISPSHATTTNSTDDTRQSFSNFPPI